MPQYQRMKIEGGIYFFTVVAYNRLPILTTEETRRILHQAWFDVRNRFPFSLEAGCLLPNHIQCIWKLPEGDSHYSVRWKEIKRLFTKGYLIKIGPGEPRTPSRRVSGEAAAWQRRFLEHSIRDERDLNRHIETIHYNPVKHGLVDRVVD